MFAGFTQRLNFGLGGGTPSIPSAFPTRPIGQLGNFNTYAINFISAAGITQSDQQSAINQLSTDLVNTGLMDKMIAVYPFVGGDATTHSYNLKIPIDSNTAFRLTFSGGWTHSSTGIKGNGSNTYATTYVNTSIAPFQQTNSHLSCYCRTTGVPGSTFEVSADNGTNFNQIAAARNYYSGVVTINTGGVNFTTTTNSAGFWCGSKTSTSQRFATRNGVLNSVVTTTTDASLGAAFNLTIGARNNSNSYTSYTSKEIAFISIGQGLTQEEHATLYTIVQNFQTTLGRQV
jgi:hypothetical protein